MRRAVRSFLYSIERASERLVAECIYRGWFCGVGETWSTWVSVWSGWVYDIYCLLNLHVCDACYLIRGTGFFTELVSVSRYRFDFDFAQSPGNQWRATRRSVAIHDALEKYGIQESPNSVDATSGRHRGT